MAPVAKRRIQPQLVLAQPPAEPPSSGAAPENFGSGSGPSLSPSVATWKPQSVKECSDFDVQEGRKGRRMYISLTGETTEVNFRKLLKEQGVTEADVFPSQPVKATIPGLPPVQLARPRYGASRNPLGAVIERLERGVVQQDSNDDSSAVEEASDSSASEEGEGEGESDGSKDAEEDSDVAIGEYDTDDSFIDNSEMKEILQGDRRKPKYSGFFINKGAIEKTDEEVELPMKGPVVRKRKKVKGPVEEASEEEEKRTGGEESEGVHSTEKLSRKRRKSGSPGRVGKKTKTKASVAEDVETTQAAAAAPSLAAQAAAAGMMASALAPVNQPQRPGHSGRPAANNDAHNRAQPTGGYALSAAVKKALEALKPHAATAREEDPTPGENKQIPKSLNPALTPIARLMLVESESDPAAKDKIIEAVIEIFGGSQAGLFSRSKIAKRLESLPKSAEADLAATIVKVKEHIEAKIRSADQRVGQAEAASDTAHRPEDFNFDRHLENHILAFVMQTNRLNGKTDEDADMATPLLPLLNYWPGGRMSMEVLSAALQRALSHPKPAPRAHRKSLDHLEGSQGPSTQTLEGADKKKATARLQSIAEDGAGGSSLDVLSAPSPSVQPELPKAAADTAPAEPSSPALAAVAHATASQHPSQEQAAALRGDAAEAGAYAVGLGADKEKIVESIRQMNTNNRTIINRVLMLAGPKGFTNQEIVDKANELGLTGDQPWDKSKKAIISQNIRQSKFHAHIGNFRYAHLAFPGTEEAAKREHELAESKKKLREEQQQKASQNPATEPSLLEL